MRKNRPPRNRRKTARLRAARKSRLKRRRAASCHGRKI